MAYCDADDVAGHTGLDYYNGRLYHGVVSGGPFVAGETITGGTSGATGTVDAVGTDYVDYTPVSGTFEAAEVITGGDSGATATTSSVEPKTQPNLAEVNDIVTNVAAEIDGVLKAAGYALPIAATATKSLALLKSYNALGGACQAWHAAVRGTDRFPAAESWCGQYKDFLARIRRNEQRLPDVDPASADYRVSFKVF